MGRATEYMYLINPRNPLPTKDEAKFDIHHLDMEKERERIKKVRRINKKIQLSLF